MRLKLILFLSLIASIAGAQDFLQHRRSKFRVPMITMGETSILATADANNANTLIAQVTTLSQTATIKSLSFYVDTAAGNLILGLYAADGASGNPGTKLAETAAFTPSVGWNTQAVVSESVLSSGTYWLAFNPSSASLVAFRNGAAPNSVYYSRTYDGTLPATFSGGISFFAAHWSFYANLQP